MKSAAGRQSDKQTGKHADTPRYLEAKFNLQREIRKTFVELRS